MPKLKDWVRIEKEKENNDEWDEKVRADRQLIEEWERQNPAKTENQLLQIYDELEKQETNQDSEQKDFAYDWETTIKNGVRSHRLIKKPKGK